MSNSLALYTTVYPGAENFLAAWHTSVCRQTDRQFDLWIGADQISPSEVFKAVGSEFHANWVAADNGSTPAEVRQAGINAILASKNGHEGIVFVDCDDIMHPARIQSARKQLEANDAAACAMEIINEDGSAHPSIFHLRPELSVPDFLTKVNAFGMSNTAYRSQTLRRIPPVLPNCRLMDWFLATACWIRGGRLDFDNTPRMQYRQYDRNVAPVLPPFSTADISRGTALVLDHYAFVLSEVPDIPEAIASQLQSALANVKLFQSRVVGDPNICEQYVARLNRLAANYVWWEWVAHRSLEELWKS